MVDYEFSLSKTVSMDFSVGRAISFDLDVGGGSPAPVPPQPTPAAVVLHGFVERITGATGILMKNALYGTAVREEEE